MATELSLIGVGHGFDRDSDVCRDLMRWVRSFGPQAIGVEVPPPEHFIEFAREHGDELLRKATRTARGGPPGTDADAHNQRGIAHFAGGGYIEAVSCFRRALTADPQHADASENMGLALHTCRGSELEYVVVPLQDELRYRVVPIGGTRLEHFRARAAAQRALAADPERQRRWETYRAFCDVIWGRVLVRYQSLAGMNSEASHALHEAAHEAIPALFGDDALDLCWAEQNRLACESIRELVEASPGARILVVYGSEHLYALLAWAASLPGVRLLGLADLGTVG